MIFRLLDLTEDLMARHTDNQYAFIDSSLPLSPVFQKPFCFTGRPSCIPWLAGFPADLSRFVVTSVPSFSHDLSGIIGMFCQVSGFRFDLRDFRAAFRGSSSAQSPGFQIAHLNLPEPFCQLSGFQFDWRDFRVAFRRLSSPRSPVFQIAYLDLSERPSRYPDLDSTWRDFRVIFFVITSITPFPAYLVVFSCQEVTNTIVRRRETDLVFDDCILDVLDETRDIP